MIVVSMRRRVLVPVAVLAILIVCLVSYFVLRATLPERLEQYVAQHFSAGTPRSEIEAWAKTQPADTNLVLKFEDGIGGPEVFAQAGLDPRDVRYTFRVEYKELRWPDRYWINLYFFFDSKDRLIKHWIDERIISL